MIDLFELVRGAAVVLLLLGTGMGNWVRAEGEQRGVFSESDVARTDFYDSSYLNVGFDFYTARNVNARYNTRAAVNRNFNGEKPTVVHVHGWSNTACVRRLKSTFNFTAYVPELKMTRIILSDAWLNRGWNVGRFTWHSWADEDRVATVEHKVLNSSTIYGMRWRDYNGRFHKSAWRKSVAEEFAQQTISIFGGRGGRLAPVAKQPLGPLGSRGPPAKPLPGPRKPPTPRASAPELRIVAISAGAPLALWAQYLILQQHGPNAGGLAHRIALLDPFASDYRNCHIQSMCGDAYKGKGGSTSDFMIKAVKALSAAGVIIEYYQSSYVNDFFEKMGLGGNNLKALRPLTAFAHLKFKGSALDKTWNPLKRLRAKHVIAEEWYYRSILYPPPPIKKWDPSADALRNLTHSKDNKFPNRKLSRGLSASTPTDIARLFVGYELKQVSGAHTKDFTKLTYDISRTPPM